METRAFTDYACCARVSDGKRCQLTIIPRFCECPKHLLDWGMRKMPLLGTFESWDELDMLLFFDEVHE